MNKYSYIDSNYHKKFYFQEGNAYIKNSLSASKISNKISIAKLSDRSTLSNSEGKTIYVKYFIRDYIKNKYNLINRIRYYKYILKKISIVEKESCLKKKRFHQKYGNKFYDGYTINDIINLEKQIGSPSNYGSIYITSIKGVVGRFPIASKLMKINNSNSLEKYLNEHITENIISKKLSKHFIITYKTLLCTEFTTEVPYIINNTNYYIVLNELAHGDLKQLVKMKSVVGDNYLINNLYIQVMLSIMTFHTLGYSHGDCHYGNFLYHKNDDVGYYHYVIYGKNYYLKSSKYNIMIFDFGFAKYNNQRNKLVQKHIEDYMRIHLAFTSKNYYKSWGYFSDLPEKKFSDYVDFQFKKLFKIKNLLQEYKNVSNFVEENILSYLMKSPSNMFTNVKPNAKIINQDPFIIDDTLHI